VTNRALRRSGQEIMIPVRGARIIKGLGSGVGIALTGVSVWDNYHSGYSKSEAFGRSAIDIVGSAAAIGLAFTPIGWVGVLVIGVGIAVGGEFGKNYLYD